LPLGGFGELSTGGFGKLATSRLRTFWPFGRLRTPNFAGGENWWRRRESNPRPKTFHSGVYILILKFNFRPARLLQAGFLKG